VPPVLPQVSCIPPLPVPFFSNLKPFLRRSAPPNTSRSALFSRLIPLPLRSGPSPVREPPCQIKRSFLPLGLDYGYVKFLLLLQTPDKSYFPSWAMDGFFLRTLSELTLALTGLFFFCGRGRPLFLISTQIRPFHLLPRVTKESFFNVSPPEGLRSPPRQMRFHTPPPSFFPPP